MVMNRKKCVKVLVVKGWGLQACSFICEKQRCNQGQNPKAKNEAKAWTQKAKTLNPQGQDQGHKFVSARILEAKACPRGLHHWCEQTIKCCNTADWFVFSVPVTSINVYLKRPVYSNLSRGDLLSLSLMSSTAVFVIAIMSQTDITCAFILI